MDKFEYKIKADEIKELIAQKEYEQAAEIADTIDWRRVKSVMMLCTISDLYKMCRRYEDSRDLLLLAYERHPGGRTIVYSLCELSIKMEEFLQAIEYYKEFVEIAPKDTGRYILQYKLYEAQDVSLEERIAVLEELKNRDYREKWAYELAYLYHRVGLATKCVEECDELFLWFGDGKYVIKALELKKLHAPLTPEQQYKYDHRFGDETRTENVNENQAVSGEVQEVSETKTVEEEMTAKEDPVLTAATTRIPVEEIEIQVKTLDVGKYDTLNLQEELAAGIQEYFGTAGEDAITRSIVAPMLTSDTEEMNMAQVKQGIPAEMKKEEVLQEESASEVFFGETGEINTEEAEQQLQQNKQLGLAKMEMPVQNVQPPKEMAGVLSMDADGQISFVIPESEPVEKQITGQISINDIVLEWEKLKKENEEKRKEDVRQRVLQQTGQMFTQFEASVRDGLLEKLESGKDVPEETLEERLTELFEVEPEKQVSAEAEEDLGEVEELTEITEPDEAEESTPEMPTEEEVEPEPALEESKEEETEPEPVSEEPKEEEVEPEPVPEEPKEVEAEPESVPEEPKEVPAEADSAAEEAAPAKPQKVRNLTREEKELYGPYIQGRSSKEQLIKAVDGISMAAYTGNVIVTGDEGMDSIGLAKNIIREVQLTDRNFSGKVAKISGDVLNSRDVKQIVDDLDNGALIIQKASLMELETADKLYKVLQQENKGIVVVLEDNKKAMDRFLSQNGKLLHCFTSRMDLAALSDDALVAFGKKYAREKEYSIDEMGLLALHTRIAEMQTSDHAVTILEVKEIMDEAIENANRKTIGHFFDIIFAKRYDEEDMIILKEKDFI